MSTHSLYLKRYAWPHPLFSEEKIHDQTGIIIVIPAYNEPDILKALHSLQKCAKPSCEVLIIVIFNESQDESAEVSSTNEKGLSQIKQSSGPYQVLSKLVKLKPKKAGVGLARKIGMDEAVRIYNKLGRDGIITCFDADCTCAKNFLIEIEKCFNQKVANTALTFYEHPMEAAHPEAIVNYELFLRYYVDALRWAGFPYAFQTLGSCISVKSSAYEQQGGMNTRKAGEDFYFIHKMTALGQIYEINATTIYPSDRLSDRVPFGTGHAIGKYLDNGSPDYPVYAPETFKDVKELLDSLPKLFKSPEISSALSPSVTTFLKANDFDQKIKEIQDQTNGYESFKKRFYVWMDGLKVLKLVHHIRDNYYPNVPLETGLSWLNADYFQGNLRYQNKEEALLAIRNYDRAHPFYTK